MQSQQVAAIVSIGACSIARATHAQSYAYAPCSCAPCPQACAAVSALLPRITHLNLSFTSNVYDHFSPWDKIFTPLHTTRTLTHLTTEETLDSELLDLLLVHAPALTDFKVESLSIDTQEYRQQQWAVRRLQFRSMYCVPGEGMEQQIVRLPSTSADQLCVKVQGLELGIKSYEVCVCMYVCVRVSRVRISKDR